MTNDGDIVNKIFKARNHHEKECLVTVNKPIAKDFITKMENGLPILDTNTILYNKEVQSELQLEVDDFL